MAEKTYLEAIREAISEEMRKDPGIVMIGEDIGVYGGAFKVTKGMLDEFGSSRIINTPMSEAALVGCGIGAALTGMRPVVEIMFMDFMTLAMDQLVNHASKFSYIYGGSVSVPLVIRTPAGAGRGYGASHSQSLESWFMHVPGMKVVAPSTPYDAKGLMKSCLKSSSPVLFIEGKMLYSKKGEVPDSYYEVPIGSADVKSAGSDLTLVSYGKMVDLCLEVANEMQAAGLSIEVVDLRSLLPIDKQLILGSLKKTGRVIIVEEDTLTCGAGSEVAAIIADEGYEFLKAPVKRLACADVPIPYCKSLELAALPDKDKLAEMILSIMEG